MLERHLCLRDTVTVNFLETLHQPLELLSFKEESLLTTTKLVFRSGILRDRNASDQWPLCITEAQKLLSAYLMSPTKNHSTESTLGCVTCAHTRTLTWWSAWQETSVIRSLDSICPDAKKQRLTLVALSFRPVRWPVKACKKSSRTCPATSSTCTRAAADLPRTSTLSNWTLALLRARKAAARSVVCYFLWTVTGKCCVQSFHLVRFCRHCGENNQYVTFLLQSKKIIAFFLLCWLSAHVYTSSQYFVNFREAFVCNYSCKPFVNYVMDCFWMCIQLCIKTFGNIIS